MITTTCLILLMPELPLDAWAGSGAPTPAVSATSATTPARLATRVGTTRAILPKLGEWIMRTVSEQREISLGPRPLRSSDGVGQGGVDLGKRVGDALVFVHGLAFAT